MLPSLSSRIAFLSNLGPLFFKRSLTLVLALIFMSFLSHADGQAIKHARSGISTTAQFHSYIHKISPTVGIEIKYFVVQAPNGDIKTAFNACDVCWAQYKGYVQLGSFVRCVNCGNTYPINDLGTAGTGGCWPSYLPHTTEPDSISILISDLVAGQGYFQEIVIIGVTHDVLPLDFMVRDLGSELVIDMPEMTPRTFRLLGIDGKLCFRTESSATRLSIPKEHLANGVYLLTVEEKGNAYYQRFFFQ